MKFYGIIGLLALLSAVALGCASIVSKTQRQITINSSPDQADVTITDERGLKLLQGKTPTTVTLKTGGGYFKGKEYTVRIYKEGYGEQTVTISKKLNAWYLGNIIFGGLIGVLIVDPLTGAMWTLDPQEIYVNLSPKISAVDGEYKDLTIFLLEDVPSHLRDKMVRIK
jgi:hypothetical protein